MTKKTLAALIAVSLLVILSCDHRPPEWPEEEDEFATDVVYSDNWNFITLYLDEVTVPDIIINTNRAMTPDTARWGFDYFEVVFIYNGTNPQITRASWEIGRRASINNVYRTETGIDYNTPPHPP